MVLVFFANAQGNDQYTKILLHFDGVNAGTSFPDTNAGGSAHTWTASSAITSTTAPVFGTANYSSSGGYITTPAHADFNLGSQDFNVDFRLKTTTGTGAVFGQSDSLGTSQSILANVGTFANKLTLTLVQGSTPYRVTSTSNVTTGAWIAGRFIRTGDILRLFINGVQEGGDVAFTGSVNSSTGSFSIGRHGDRTPNAYVGELDEFRFDVGIARSTGNYTVPVNPYGP